MGIHNKSISRRIFIKFISLEAISLYLMRCNKRDHENSTMHKELNELLVETPYVELGDPDGDGFYIIPNNALRKTSKSSLVFRRIVIEDEVFIISSAVNTKSKNNNLMAEPSQRSEKYQIKKGDQLFISNNNFNEIFSKKYTKAHRCNNKRLKEIYHPSRTP